ncbi:MAG: hypothetical protein ABSD40_25625 [Streptosporangiaceae bacterium]
MNALTISIGGNDIGFSIIVEACMVPLNSCPTDPTITTMLAGDLHNLGGYPAGSPLGILGELGELVDNINSRPDIDNVFLTEHPDPTTGPGGFLCGSYELIQPRPGRRSRSRLFASTGSMPGGGG